MTKSIVIFVVLLSVFVATNGKTLREELKPYAGIPRDSLGDIIIKVVNCVINELKQNPNIFGNFSIEPLEIDNFELDFDEESLSGNVTIANLVLAGLSSLEIPLLDTGLNSSDGTIGGFISINPEFEFKFDELSIKTGYGIAANIFSMIPLSGNGNLSLSLSELDLMGQFFVSIDPIVIRADYFTLKLKSFDIFGLLDDEFMNNIIQTQIRNIIQQVIDENKDGLDLTDVLKQLIASIDLTNTDIGDIEIPDDLLTFLLGCIL